LATSVSILVGVQYESSSPLKSERGLVKHKRCAMWNNEWV
jgi:hypothetical protein